MQFMHRRLDERTDPGKYMPGAQSVVCVALNYHVPLQPVPERERAEHGRVARYALARDYHEHLKDRLYDLADWIREIAPGARTRCGTDSAPIAERELAARAGIGWVGKNTCVIHPQLGSWVLLGEVLTTLALPPDEPIPDHCGTCTRCIDACPTQAITAPHRLDATRCISYLTIEHRGPIADALADRMGERVAGCDVCQEVCPYNASTTRDSRVPPVAWIDPAPRPLADVEGLAAISPSQYRAQTRHLAVRRIPRRHMRRNALLALGNREGPPGPRELHALALGLLDKEPQIVAAARRAAMRRDALAVTETLAAQLHISEPEPDDP
jgi:epoxyqueuosine reductase